MKRNRDPLGLSPHWHIDCRLEAELPEDTIIGRRFLVHVGFVAVALGALLFTGYQSYVMFSLRHQIRDWEQRISDNRAEVRDIQRMQKDYAAEALKIDQAHALVRPQFYVSGLVASLGRTRPERMAIDIIEWNDAGVILRGNLRERSDRATEMLGGYVEQLRRDKQIGPLFREIVLTDLDRGSSGEMLRFEIRLALKPAS
jgi:hypothetical protein